MTEKTINRQLELAATASAVSVTKTWFDTQIEAREQDEMFQPDLQQLVTQLRNIPNHELLNVPTRTILGMVIGETLAEIIALTSQHTQAARELRDGHIVPGDFSFSASSGVIEEKNLLFKKQSNIFDLVKINPLFDEKI